MIDLPQTAAALRSVDKELGCGCYSVPRSTGGISTEQRKREKKKKRNCDRVRASPGQWRGSLTLYRQDSSEDRSFASFDPIL